MDFEDWFCCGSYLKMLRKYRKAYCHLCLSPDARLLVCALVSPQELRALGCLIVKNDVVLHRMHLCNLEEEWWLSIGSTRRNFKNTRESVSLHARNTRTHIHMLSWKSVPNT